MIKASDLWAVASHAADMLEDAATKLHLWTTRHYFRARSREALVRMGRDPSTLGKRVTRESDGRAYPAPGGDA